MKVAYVLHFYEKGMAPREMLEKHYSTRHNLTALRNEGAELSVFYRSEENEVFEQDGIVYHFIKDGQGANPKKWQACTKFNTEVSKLIREKGIHIVQAHNPFSALCHRSLQKMNTHIPYLVQDHSGLDRLSKQKLLKTILKNIDGLLFSSPGLEAPWIEAKIVDAKKCHFVMEASCEWRMDHKLLQGYEPKNVPRFLWIGNLDQNKDPLLILKALGQYRKQNKHFRLQMIYRNEDIENDVKNFVKANDLTQQVNFIGYVPRERIYLYLHQNDYFIAASHKEGSGYALMEAMACGLIPIVSRIPTFIDLTQKEEIGYLFEKGNENELLKILKQLPTSATGIQKREAVVEAFDAKFSYQAIAKKMVRIYRQAIESKKS